MRNKSLRERYRQHCREEMSIPIFSRDWWLDAVCGEANWDAAIVEKGGSIVGSLPYFIKKQWGLTLLVQPPLTQALGPWLRPSTAKYSKSLGYQKDVMNALIDQLPLYDYFSQNWHYSNTNWSPFYWKGFKQSSYYTYVLSNLIDEKQLWEGLETKVRSDIKKAKIRFNLKVRDDLSVDDFFRIMQKSFGRQDMKMPCSNDLVSRLDSKCHERNCRKIWIAEDEEGNHHAGAYVVWDDNSAYYVMGGGDPGLRNSGAASLVLWEAIRHASTVTRVFDFEGSMVEGIERFFRGFGGRQELFYNLKKTNSRLLHIRQCFLDMP